MCENHYLNAEWHKRIKAGKKPATCRTRAKKHDKPTGNSRKKKSNDVLKAWKSTEKNKKRNRILYMYEYALHSI